MKEGWEYKTLGEVAKIIHGKNQKDVLSDDGKYPIYGSGGNIIGYSKEYLCTAGTTILGRKGSINNPFFIEENFWNVDTAFGISAKDNYSSKFIFYYCKSKDWNKLNTGTTLPSLTQSVVKSQIIAVPSYDEQRRIVSYLDSSFKLIDEIKNKALKSLTEAKALFQSALAEAMEPKEGWEEKTLGEVSENIKNINWKNESSAYKYIDLSSVDRDKSIILNTVIVNKTNAPSRAKQLVNKNDIIFATTRPLLRRVTLIEKEYDKSICSTGFCVIRPNSNIIVPKYVFYVFKDEPFYQYIEPLQNGASYPAVTDKAVKSYTFSFPKNVEVQKQIVSRLDKLSSKVRAIEEKYQKMVEECDALKQAMLRDVFE